MHLLSSSSDIFSSFFCCKMLRLCVTVVLSPVLFLVFAVEYVVHVVLNISVSEFYLLVYRAFNLLSMLPIVIFLGPFSIFYRFTSVGFEVGFSLTDHLQYRWIGIRALKVTIQFSQKLFHLITRSLYWVYYNLAYWSTSHVYHAVILTHNLFVHVVKPLHDWNIFAYGPMTSPSNEIRLLKIYPGISSAKLLCKFVKSNWDSSIYDAVSYTWETDLVFRRFIYLDGRRFLVADNVYRILKQLRKPNECRLVRLDAICINQANVNERSSQVQMMRNIYGAAQEVIIWLGQAPDGVEILFDTAMCY